MQNSKTLSLKNFGQTEKNTSTVVCNVINDYNAIPPPPPKNN